MDDLRPGDTFAGCRIEAVVGRGGMGVVYRATELTLERRVALKVVAPENVADAGFAERFGREVRHAASIDHPNIVPVYGAGQDGERLYLVMRYVDGTDLQALIAEAGRLAPARAAAIVAQLAAGLDAAHVAGLVHRDVKPGNVLLTSGASASDVHVYLSDFGLTVEVSSDARMTTTGHWIGSVDYMAPEQLRAEDVDARTDVYALGGVLHAALTGQAPFHRKSVPQTIAAHLNDPPPRPTALAPVDPVFDAVVARALAKDPADRYGSAGDLGRAALAAVRGEHVTIGERVVARGPAAPSEDPTRKLAAPVPPRVAPTRSKDEDVVIPARVRRLERRRAAPARPAEEDAVVPPGVGRQGAPGTSRRGPRTRTSASLRGCARRTTVPGPSRAADDEVVSLHERRPDRSRDEPARSADDEVVSPHERRPDRSRGEPPRSADDEVVPPLARRPDPHRAAPARSAGEDAVVPPRGRRPAAKAPAQARGPGVEVREVSGAARGPGIDRPAKPRVAAPGALALPRGARPPALPAAPAPAELAAGRRHRSRKRVRIALAAFAAVGAAAAAIAVATTGDEPRAVSASLSVDEIRRAAQDFAAAYGDEDAAALRATLASNVQRVGPDGAQRGRDDVLAVYRRQFGDSDVDAYELDDVAVVRGAAGRAAGSYKVTRAGRDDITGRVAFGVVREAGAPRIAMIATQPD